VVPQQFTVFLVAFKNGPQSAFRSASGALSSVDAIEIIPRFYREKGREVTTIVGYGQGFHRIFTREKEQVSYD